MGVDAFTNEDVEVICAGSEHVYREPTEHSQCTRGQQETAKSAEDRATLYRRDFPKRLGHIQKRNETGPSLQSTKFRREAG